MKKFICFLLASILALSFGTACSKESSTYTITFVQEGQEDVVISAKKGEVLTLPSVVPSELSNVVIEWNVQDDFIPDKDQTIYAISYTLGLEFSTVTYNMEYCIKIKRYTGESAEVVVPDYYKGLPVKVLGERAFESQNHVTKITLPNGLEKVEYHPFMYTSNIVDVNIPTSLKELADYAFSDAHNYGTVTIPGSVDTLPDHAFFGFRGERAIIEEGVVNIKEYVLGGKNSMKEIVLPLSVREISGRAFHLQPLVTIYYGGRESEFDFIMFGEDRHQGYKTIEEKIEDGAITVYYFSESQPQESGIYWHYVDNVPTIWE